VVLGSPADMGMRLLETELNKLTRQGLKRGRPRKLSGRLIHALAYLISLTCDDFLSLVCPQNRTAAIRFKSRYVDDSTDSLWPSITDPPASDCFRREGLTETISPDFARP